MKRDQHLEGPAWDPAAAGKGRREAEGKSGHGGAIVSPLRIKTRPKRSSEYVGNFGRVLEGLM